MKSKDKRVWGPNKFVIAMENRTMELTMELTEEQKAALIAWANEGDRKDGTTAWGPTFTAAMRVAQAVRDRAKAVPTLKTLQMEVRKELSECVIDELADQGELDLRTKHSWQLLMEHVNKRNRYRGLRENAMYDSNAQKREHETLIAQMAATLLAPLLIPSVNSSSKHDRCIARAVDAAEKILAEARK